MNTLRRISVATALSLTLAVAAFAGQIDTPGATQPQPPPGEESSTPPDITTYIILTITSLIYR